MSFILTYSFRKRKYLAAFLQREDRGRIFYCKNMYIVLRYFGTISKIVLKQEMAETEKKYVSYYFNYIYKINYIIIVVESAVSHSLWLRCGHSKA